MDASTNAPTVPPDLDAVRRLLRPRMADIPTILAEWPRGEGPLADVPLLHPGDMDPWAFTELAGTVRVAAAGTDLVTVSGLLEIPDGSGILITTMTISPHDLGGVPDPDLARSALAAEGARSDGVPLEVAALLGTVDGAGAPAVGVGIVRPLVLAHPTAFPHEADRTAWPTAVHEAVAAAVAEDREVITDLGGRPLDPLAADVARIWSPMFLVARAATVGLAARSAS